MSEESEQGDGRELVSRAVGNGQLWDGSHRMVESRGGMWSDVGVKRFLPMVTGGATEEAVRGLGKAEGTEVWAQARDSVSRAAASQHRKPSDSRS